MAEFVGTHSKPGSSNTWIKRQKYVFLYTNKSAAFFFFFFSTIRLILLRRERVQSKYLPIYEWWQWIIPNRRSYDTHTKYQNSLVALWWQNYFNKNLIANIPRPFSPVRNRINGAKHASLTFHYVCVSCQFRLKFNNIYLVIPIITENLIHTSIVLCLQLYNTHTREGKNETYDIWETMIFPIDWIQAPNNKNHAAKTYEEKSIEKQRDNISKSIEQAKIVYSAIAPARDTKQGTWLILTLAHIHTHARTQTTEKHNPNGKT